MIKVVFLDIDNTLLSFSGYVKEAMRDGFARFGCRPYEEAMFPVFERINNRLWEEIEQGTLTFEELLKIRWNRFFEALGIDFDGETFETYFRERLCTSAIPEPHAAELLEYLRPRYVLCAASNGPYEQQVNRLRIADMYDCFSHFFISERIGADKPSPAFFDACFRVLRSSGLPGLLPEETMIIGDSMTSDMAGGIGYGMHTCLYLRGEEPGADIPGIDARVRSLADIKQIL